jgi:protein-S-isoprenylcysteine O-methyltransferase Ste14
MFYFIGKGTPVPIDPPKHLVIKGIYKRTRNPMYLSVLIIIFGYFLFFGHLALLMYLASLAGFFHLFVVLYEEPTLKKKFGKSYFRYLKEAPRWI